MDDFELIIELAHVFDSDPVPVILAAMERDVPLSDVVEAYLRALRPLRVHDVGAACKAPVTVMDALPPGMLDPRIVLQGQIWVDILRRPFLVAEMDQRYALNVIVHLHLKLDSLVEVTGSGGDPHAWLDQTPLLQALRCRVSEPSRSELSAQGDDPE